jgi:hypothetical protein
MNKSLTIKTPKERKAAQRAKDAAAGIHRLELVLTGQEYDALISGCARRNPGRSPYQGREYIALLLLTDKARLERQENSLGRCKRCGEKLPAGCRSLHKGEAACWFTRDCLQMNLTSVTGHANLWEPKP